MYILGISALYHDSAAALIRDGEIIAAAQEERFSRVKHDSRFPKESILFCLREAGISLNEIENVVFYDKPLVKFERILETYLAYAPKGFLSFIKAMPVWLSEKLFLKRLIRRELAALSGLAIDEIPQLLFNEHHRSHAASAFFASPFTEAAVLCLDGVGEWATTSVWYGRGGRLEKKWEIDFPHSLGLLYSAFTYYVGFKVNSGEYKLMGLAPYGEPKYLDEILESLIDLKNDGTFHLNMQYFNFAVGLTMTNSKFHKLFGGPPREPEAPLTQRHMDLAASVQAATEEIVLRLARTIRSELKTGNLCLAGGVALNCVANGKLQRLKVFDQIWIQPAAGDAGGALGAALSAWHEYHGQPREVAQDSMKGAYLGPKTQRDEVLELAKSVNAVYEEHDDAELFDTVAQRLAEGRVVGWMQGRMEFGPRALGARSILADARDSNMQSKLNLKIKFRESFRPFAPAVLFEDVAAFFETQEPSPYMLFVANLNSGQLLPSAEKLPGAFGIERLKQIRSKLPAITHVDNSARIQTVHHETNPRFHRLLESFKAKTGVSVLANTSFNVRGEPIVCSAADAYRCFMRTEMDYLVIENFTFDKSKQPKPMPHEIRETAFELD